MGEAALHPRRAHACAAIALAVCLATGGVAQAQPQRRDTARPSKPSVRVLGIGRRSIYIRWKATDNRGIVSFSLFRSGNLVKRTRSTEATLTALRCSDLYRVDVDAVDGAQNHSGKSGVYVRTAPCAPGTTPPASATGSKSATTTTTTTTPTTTPASPPAPTAAASTVKPSSSTSSSSPSSPATSSSGSATSGSSTSGTVTTGSGTSKDKGNGAGTGTATGTGTTTTTTTTGTGTGTGAGTGTGGSSTSGSVANLWVSPAGAASCARSATPINYATALTGHAVCDTADRAYHAAANGGDLVRVLNGTYPGLSFSADASKTGATTVFEPDTAYGVTLTSATSFGPNASFITVRNFNVVSPTGGFVNSTSGLSQSVTIDGNHINIGQKVNGRPGAILFYTNIDGYKIINNVVGPTCCGSTNQSSPVGITIGKSNNLAPNANNVLIDNNTIQFTIRNAAYWPSAGFGAAPDVSCMLSSCHQDAIQIWGIQNSTISNNKIYNAEVQGIFIEDAAGAVNKNINLFNNAILMVGGNAAMNLKGIDGSWNIAFNSTPNAIVLGYGFAAATPGTRVNFVGNDAALLMADATGNNASCTDGNAANVAFSYQYDVWRPMGGAMNTPCSSTDVVASPAFANTAAGPATTADLHLAGANAQADNKVPAGVCTALVNRDRDGNGRPMNGSCDAGAFERNQ